MKKIVLSFVCVLIACVASYAQGVKFETGVWNEMLEKARTTEKMVFVDVYTQWCGPCKQVSQNVFPQEKLGEFYNEHFINFKIDAESPEGKEFVKQYPVTGYPTFFFIDGTGRVIHKVVGARDVDGFLQEAKMISMYAKYGGIDNMMAAIKNGTASKELLYDYYKSANKRTKPTAVNLYLKALSPEELIDVDNKAIEDISLYDRELINRFIEEIIKVSHSEKFNDKKYTATFVFNVVFPIQWDLTTYFNKSIEEDNEEWFNELLTLKEKFNGYKGRALDGDLKIMRGRGLFFATPEYIKLCYWTKNRSHREAFKEEMVKMMDKLIAENQQDTLLKEKNLAFIKGITKDNAQKSAIYFVQNLCEKGNITAHNILDWTDYFWKLSSSDKKTRQLCSQWINFAFNLNPYNATTALPAATLLSRIGNFKDAKVLLETAIRNQKELNINNPKLFREMELKLWEVNNRKI